MSKQKILFLCIAAVVMSSVSFAQSPAQPRRRSHDIVDFILRLQEKRIVEIAEVMPAEKYSFAPSSAGFKGVRTFGEQLRHIAVDNYVLGAGILGEKPPVEVPTPDISSWPQGTATRLGLAIENCVHSWDHYGQLVEYLRMNGIVPPASRK